MKLEGYSCLLQTITVEQEATLETLAYPFLPDWHSMACVLALQRQAGDVSSAEIASMALPDLSLDSPLAARLAPVVTPAELLLQPMMSHGMGLRLACEGSPPSHGMAAPENLPLQLL